MLTGDYRYKELGDITWRSVQIDSANSKSGFKFLPRNGISPDNTNVFNHGMISMGGESDSYAEYLLKGWIQSGKKDTELLELWNGVMDEVISILYHPSISYGIVAPVASNSLVLNLPREDVAKIFSTLDAGTYVTFINRLEKYHKSISAINKDSTTISLPFPTNLAAQRQWEMSLNRNSGNSTTLDHNNVTSNDFKLERQLLSPLSSSRFPLLSEPRISLTPALTHLYKLSLQIGTPSFEILTGLHAILPDKYPNPLTSFGILSKSEHNSLVSPRYQLEHLVCFLPGSMYLGVANIWDTLPENEKRSLDSPMVDRNTLQRLLLQLIIEAEQQGYIQDSRWRRVFRLLAQLELGSSIEDGCLAGYEASAFKLGFEQLHMHEHYDTSSYSTLDSSVNPNSLGQRMAPKTPQKTMSLYEVTKNYHSSLLNETLKAPMLRLLPYPDIHNTKYNLRPETVESLFYLHYFTGDPKYRRIGVTLFNSINTYLRTAIGYASTTGQTAKMLLSPKRPELLDSMESFFTAETLKYFFLLFAPPEFIDLDKYVFSTEGHPLVILPSDKEFPPHDPILSREFREKHMFQ